MVGTRLPSAQSNGARRHAALVANLATRTTERNQLLADVEAAAILAKTRAYLDLAMNSEYFDQLAQEGVDFTSLDELLALLGEDRTEGEWAGSRESFTTTQRFVYAIGDTELTEDWDAYLDTTPGTTEETQAWMIFIARLNYLAITATDAG